MDQARWSETVLRIARQDADDIDDLLADAGPQPEGRAIFPEVDAVLMPNATMKRADAVSVGIRAAPQLPDAADRAMRLAAFAIERDVEIVVLAEGDTAGMERFGFRTERVAGEGPAREACEDQIRRFWNIDLVL